MFSFTAKCSITMYVMPQVSLFASELVVTMSCVFFSVSLCRSITGYESFRIRVGVVDVAT